MRINKFIALAGIASRRASDELILEGKVKINGKVATIGCEVDEHNDHVTVNGGTISAVKRYEYYVMNKPKGCVCTVTDDKERKTVMDYMPQNIKRVYPVGRLDYDTEGMLILTNDGDLTYRLTHPKNEVPKTYLVKVEGDVSDEDVEKLKNGVYVDGVKTKKSNVKIVEHQKRKFTKLHIIITEGRNRQVRKMLEAVNKEVIFLKRIKIGDLQLRGLERGEVRKLSPEEVMYLKNV